MSINQEASVSLQSISKQERLYDLIINSSKGLLKSGTPDEISGVLVHELGHLEHGDTKRRAIALVINTARNLAAWVLIVLVTVMGVGGQIGGSMTRQTSVSLIGLVLVLFALFLKSCLWLLQLLISLGFLAVGRKEEFAADAYARKIGFADGLASHLRKVEHLDIQQPAGVWAVLTRSHPPVPVRIDKLLYNTDECL